MNKKVMFYFVLSSLLSFNFYAEEKLGIATILVYDSNNQIISPAENPENKIYQESLKFGNKTHRRVAKTKYFIGERVNVICPKFQLKRLFYVLGRVPAPLGDCVY